MVVIDEDRHSVVKLIMQLKNKMKLLKQPEHVLLHVLRNYDEKKDKYIRDILAALNPKEQLDILTCEFSEVMKATTPVVNKKRIRRFI